VGRVANTGAVDETRQNTGIYESAKHSQRREMGRSYQFDLITRENPTPQKPVARGQQRKLRARRQALPQSPQERATPKELLGRGQPSNGDPSGNQY
jgi:ribosomal protein S8E